MVSVHGRDLLAARTRVKPRRDDDGGDREIAQPRREPGKQKASDVDDAPRPVEGAAPGKQRRSDVDFTAMSPSAALSNLDTMLARGVDRRAEPGGDTISDDGALGSAFSFIDSAAGGRELPAALRAKLERELDVDLSRARIFTDDRAAAAAAALRARAFTIGSDIYFASGAYDPETDAGVELIAHEVAHVAQNLGGGRKPGRVSRPDDQHERQADSFARSFASRSWRHQTSDPAELVEKVRREGKRLELPFLTELENHFGTSLDFVETFTGEAAQLACGAIAASAFAVRNIIALADPSPNRDTLMHELTHIVQMGGRSTRAPARFAPGSLSVGAAGSAVEREAEAGPERPIEHADPDVLHRAGPGDSTSSSGDAGDYKKRVTDFITSTGKKSKITSFVAKDKRPTTAFGYKDGKGYARYLKSEETAWGSGTYTAKSDKNKADDLKQVVDAGGSIEGLRLHKAGSKFVFTQAYKDDTYKDTVEALDIPSKWTTAYWGNGKRGISALPDVAKDFQWGDKKFDAWDPAITDAELSDYRDAIEKYIAEAYKAKPGKWDDFYKDVVEANVFPHPYKRIVGNVFEKLVAASTKGEKEYPVDAKQVVIYKKGKKGKAGVLTAIGDGKVGKEAGKQTILAECKAWTKPPGSTEKTQASRYLDIIENGTSYVETDDAGTVTQVDFDHIVYYFASSKVADLWRPMLEDVFGGPEGKAGYNNRKFTVVPPFSGTKKTDFKIRYNPEFAIPFEPGKTHVHLAAPPIQHAGFQAKDLDATLDDSGMFQSGSMMVGIDMGNGALKAPPKKVTLDKSETGDATGTNQFSGLTGKLDKILGDRIKPDAKLVDDGIEASVTITAGKSGISGLDLTGGDLKVTYTNGGALTAKGTVGVEKAVGGGKISGSLTVGWSGSEFSVAGDVTVSDGVIAGVKKFTADFSYDHGEIVIGCPTVQIEKKFSAITLTGTGRNLTYNAKTGKFSGSATLEADLGMFGMASASATITDNKLAKAELSYDSPEFKYPAKSSNPTFSGTIGGTVTYENEKFSGSVRGNAKLNVPALQKIAGEGGLGVAVDGHIKGDGSYGGTIKTTSPLKFGKYFEIPSLGCTIEDDGSVTGEFAIKIKQIKYLESAEIGCKIDKTGFHVKKADIHAAIGKPTDKMWGTLDVGYDDTTGLKITGTLNVKIKEGMVAKGTLTYNSEKNTIDVALTVDEITLFDFTKKKNLFTFSKQIPLVSFYNIIGIYLDLGLDLDFDFSMKLGLKPTITLDGLSFETWHYDKISAEIELLGQLRAALTASPKVGLGLFAVSPSLLRGGGGIKIPITGEALLNPTGKFKVSYNPSGGVEGEAKVGMQLTFGIKGAVKPYAEAAVLDGAWNPKWDGDALAEFEILPPKELFNFTLDLAGDMSKKEPALPSGPQAPSATTGKQIAQEAPRTKQAGDNGPGKDAVPPTSGPADGGADDSVFKMATLTSALKGLPGYATISGFMDKAAKVWDKIKGFFGRVAKAFKSFFESIGNAIEEVINGFASEGLAYLPKLIQKIVGPDTWDVIEPIVKAAAGTAEQILGLFETDPPKNVADFFPWALKLMQKAFGVGFGSIGALISALNTMLNRLGGLAKKIVNKMVQDGMIGVKRHQYHYWAFGTHYFLAADEYKINLLGTNIYFRESGMLLNPNDLVGAGLFTAFETMGVPPTNLQVDAETGEAYRDRWK